MPKQKVDDIYSRYKKASPDDLKQRIIAASYGEVGTLKSSFWLGAPAPIGIQTLDEGLEGVVESFAKTKDIYVAEYDLGRNPGETFTVQRAVEARDKFIEDFEHMIGTMRTIVWDRESDMWPLFFFAEFGTDDAFAAAPPKDWDRLKGKIRRLISMAKASDVNFGIIQGMKNEWGAKVNNKTGAKGFAQTGARCRSGMDDIDALVHINIEHFLDPMDNEFKMRVGKARGPGGREIQNTVLPAMTFSQFSTLVFPETEESDWV